MDTIELNTIRERRMRLNYIYVYALLFIISFVYLLAFSSGISPLLSYGGSDSGIFITIGDYWLNKGVIYKEIFDNKGPYLFFIQALGQLIYPGKWGIFLLEVINLSICLKILYEIGYLICKSKTYTCICLVGYLIFFTLFIARGNTVEEWSLPFVLYPLLLYFKSFADSGQKKSNYKKWIIYGVCFGVLALMRINNAAILVGIIVAESIEYICNTEFAKIVRLWLSALFGLLLSTAPMLAYFYFHNALYDMMYATFIYNIKYKSLWNNHGLTSMISNAKLMAPMALTLIFSWFIDKKTGSKTFLVTIAISVMSFLTFVNGTTYNHYFIMTLPIIYLGFVYAGCAHWIVRLAALLIVALVYSINYHTGYMINYLRLRDTEEYIETPKDIVEKICNLDNPQLDSVYMLNPDYRHWDFLFSIGRYPIGKYFTQQDRIVDIDPDYLRHDISKHFEYANPMWVIGTCKIVDSPLRKFAYNYSLIDSVKVALPTNTFKPEVIYYFYKRKDLCQTGQ